MDQLAANTTYNSDFKLFIAVNYVLKLFNVAETKVDINVMVLSVNVLENKVLKLSEKEDLFGKKDCRQGYGDWKWRGTVMQNMPRILA